MKNFMVKVQDRATSDQPCYLEVFLNKPIGLDDGKSIVFDMPEGTNPKQAEAVAAIFNDLDVTLKIFSS